MKNYGFITYLFFSSFIYSLCPSDYFFSDKGLPQQLTVCGSSFFRFDLRCLLFFAVLFFVTSTKGVMFLLVSVGCFIRLQAAFVEKLLANCCDFLVV